MSNKNSIGRTFIVAGALCIVCSIIVTSAAVVLKPKQEANQIRDQRKNILEAAGVSTEGKDVNALYAEYIETRYVDLSSGEFTKAPKDPKLNSIGAAKIADQSKRIPASEDLADIKRRATWGEVYFFKEAGKVSRYIFPIRGKGLWSTMYGFLAIQKDLKTVAGITFYQHGETPGLGGEIENPNWKAGWKGKKLYSEDGELALKVIKGQVNDSMAHSEHLIDGLSGATITARGVSHTVQYWLGESGYGKFLDKMREGGAANG